MIQNRNQSTCPIKLVTALVTNSCLFYDPMDSSPTSSSVHGILHARILELSSHSLLQGIFPTQGVNPGFLHCSRFFII